MGVKDDFSSAMKKIFYKPEVDFEEQAEFQEHDIEFTGQTVTEDIRVYEQARSAEGSIISAQTKIQGDIESVDSIEIAGEVQGEILSKSDVAVEGKIRGDITAAKVSANGSVICGNIHSKTDVFVNEQAQIKGDISARSASLKGTIEGNIFTGEELVIGEGAIIDGDICTTHLEIKKGAVVNSKITMNKPKI